MCHNRGGHHLLTEVSRERQKVPNASPLGKQEPLPSEGSSPVIGRAMLGRNEEERVSAAICRSSHHSDVLFL